MQNIAVPITGMTGETVMCWGEGCYGDIAKDHVTCFRAHCRHALGQGALGRLALTAAAAAKQAQRSPPNDDPGGGHSEMDVHQKEVRGEAIATAMLTARESH